MDKIDRWSELYGIDAQTIRHMYGADTWLEAFYNNDRLIHKVLRRNSEWLQKFLANLPAPDRSAEIFGVSVELMFPTVEAYRAIFEGILHPRETLAAEEDEIATWRWTSTGMELYQGPTITRPDKSTAPNLPSYVHMIGPWKKGFQEMMTRLPGLIQKDFFVYAMAAGDYYSHEDGSAGVGSHKIGYYCRGGVYNPSASLYTEGLNRFWNKKAAAKIKASIEALKADFFKTEEKDPDALPDAFSPYRA